jgi:hypothetical protein
MGKTVGAYVATRHSIGGGKLQAHLSLLVTALAVGKLQAHLSLLVTVLEVENSRGRVDSVPDSLLLRKSGSAGNRARTSGSVAR